VKHFVKQEAGFSGINLLLCPWFSNIISACVKIKATAYQNNAKINAEIRYTTQLINSK